MKSEGPVRTHVIAVSSDGGATVEERVVTTLSRRGSFALHCDDPWAKRTIEDMPSTLAQHYEVRCYAVSDVRQRGDTWGFRQAPGEGMSKFTPRWIRASEIRMSVDGPSNWYVRRVATKAELFAGVTYVVTHLPSGMSCFRSASRDRAVNVLDLVGSIGPFGETVPFGSMLPAGPDQNRLFKLIEPALADEAADKAKRG